MPTPKVTPEQKLNAQAHCLRLLNELESVMTGWVLQHDREKIAKLLDPVMDLLDRD